MLLFAAHTRYSLVKGERIVRFVLTTQLHVSSNGMTANLMLTLDLSPIRIVNVVLKVPLI